MGTRIIFSDYRPFEADLVDRDRTAGASAGAVRALQRLERLTSA